MKKRIALALIALTLNAHALQDTFDVTDAAKMATRIAGGFSLGLIDSIDYWALFAVAAVLIIFAFFIAFLAASAIIGFVRKNA